MTRPTYDPMRAPAPVFPRHRFSRIHDEATVNELAVAYETLTYEQRVHFSRQVTSAPDERLRELADELAQADQGQTAPPAEPVPAADPAAPAVNQAAAQAGETPPPAPDAQPQASIAAGEPAIPPPPTVTAPDAPAAPALPVPPDQLPQLKVPELQQVAEQVGVAKSGTKQELVDRITAATGETPAITPEQAAADAASSPQNAPDAPAEPETPATPTGAADGPQVAPATPGTPAGTPTTDGATP
jgi:hypothetical protein